MPAQRTQTVSFTSGANRLVGNLHSGAEPAPGIVITGSWTTVKEQMADLYARELAALGFTTLAFDFANFGESAGAPRQREDPLRKIADIDAAARWLAARPEVSTGMVGGLAVCASAGYMAHAIAGGTPFAAFVTVAAWLHDAGTVGEMYGGEKGVAQRIADGKAARAAYDATGTVEYVPAYSATDPKAAMGAMVQSYYGDPKKGALPSWNNRFAVLSWPDWLTFDGLARAREIGVPTLMVHSEKAAFPDNVRRFAAALTTPAETVWHEGTQLDFYSEPAQVDFATRRAAEHFRATLRHGERAA